MPNIIYKYQPKHKMGYDEFGVVCSIDDAEKIINGKKARYFLFQDQSFELILKDGLQNIKHFAVKSNGQVFINGANYNYSQSAESPEHYDAKLKVVKQSFFNWNGYKILIDSPKLERRLEGTMFRADLLAIMKDGAKIVIEIIKTSDLSQNKKTHLRENNIPTFIIYIDKDGNFEHEKFDIIGVREIEQIEESIQKGISNIREIRDKIYRLEEQCRYRERKNQDEIQAYLESSRRAVDEKERELHEKRHRDGFVNERKVHDLSEQIKSAIWLSRMARDEQRDIIIKIGQILDRIGETKIEFESYEWVLNLDENFNYEGVIYLNGHTKIIDVNLFVKSHIQVVKANRGNKTYKPYYDRLIELKKVIEI